MQNISKNLPKLIAFDLDGTIWAPDMYMLWGGGGSPFIDVGNGQELKDRAGNFVRLLGISSQILHKLKYDIEWQDSVTAWVSCTDEPNWARECLQKFKSQPGNQPIANLITTSHIYKANKQTHFKNLKKEFPNIAYNEMIFFDNQMDNIESVEQLGVNCVYCPDGVTQEIWDIGINNYIQKNKRSK